MNQSYPLSATDVPIGSFQPKISYADDKGKNIGAIKHEIESVFTSGMSKLMDEEQLELQKLDAL